MSTGTPPPKDIHLHWVLLEDDHARTHEILMPARSEHEATSIAELMFVAVGAGAFTPSSLDTPFEDKFTAIQRGHDALLGNLFHLYDLLYQSGPDRRAFATEFGTIDAQVRYLLARKPDAANPQALKRYKAQATIRALPGPIREASTLQRMAANPFEPSSKLRARALAAARALTKSIAIENREVTGFYDRIRDEYIQARKTISATARQRITLERETINATYEPFWRDLRRPGSGSPSKAALRPIITQMRNKRLRETIAPHLADKRAALHKAEMMYRSSLAMRPDLDQWQTEDHQKQWRQVARVYTRARSGPLTEPKAPAQAQTFFEKLVQRARTQAPPSPAPEQNNQRGYDRER